MHLPSGNNYGNVTLLLILSIHMREADLVFCTSGVLLSIQRSFVESTICIWSVFLFFIFGGNIDEMHAYLTLAYQSQVKFKT